MMLLKPAVPHPPPADAEETDTIKKLANYVARNGEAFEEKVRQNKAGDPKFNFLSVEANTLGFHFYQWELFCSKHQYTQDQVTQIEDNFRNQISNIQPGCIDLTPDDSAALISLLRQNSGSKDSIKSLRRWLLERAHSLSASTALMYNYCKSLQLSGASKESFTGTLHTIYVINDILFNGSGATTAGPYTRLMHASFPVVAINCIAPYLPFILRLSYACTTADTERERLTKMIAIWVGKEFISEATGSYYGTSMLETDLVHEDPEYPQLASPYPQNIPPPNHIPQQQQQQQQQSLPQFHQPQMVLDPMTGFLRPQFPPAPGLPMGPAQHIIAPGMQQLHLPGQPPYQMTPLGGPGAVFMTSEMFGGQQGFLPPGGGMGSFPPTLGTNSYTVTSIPSMFQPIAALPAPPQISTPAIDLHKTSVGTMANIMKTAIKAGHPRYVPIDKSTVAQHVPPYVEPGRLEARVAEFYKKSQAILQPMDPSSIVAASVGAGLVPGFAAGFSTGASGLGPGPAPMDVSSSGGGGGAWGSGRSDLDASVGLGGSFQPRYPPPPPPTPLAHAAPLAEDNLGHMMLRGMGWQEGSGLGADGAGRVDIIKEVGNKGKMGVGAGADPVTIAGDFSSYRQMQSESYHTKIGDRERQ